MLTTVKGFFKDGKITLSEPIDIADEVEVLVTFLAEKKEPAMQQRKIGSLKGRIKVPADFNEPLTDLKDYME